LFASNSATRAGRQHLKAGSSVHANFGRLIRVRDDGKPTDANPSPESVNMGKEIERKFLVKGDDFKTLAKGTRYRQGYLNSTKDRVVRVRTAGAKGFLTVKGIVTGATRIEFEYEIPFEDADVMLAEVCEKPLIDKKRYTIQHAGCVWEVDEFFGVNQGLVLAEVELVREDQPFDRPFWIGREVTGDPKYFNSNLIRHPYKNW
jgi:adenylate cyclase